MPARTDSLGFCPSCEASGPACKPCPEAVCARRGYHFVPLEFAPPHGGETLDPLIGRCIDEYLVVRVIGKGGFGRIYLALQQPIGLKAAIKLLHADELGGDIAKTLRNKFEGEAAALAVLQHPNIVRLLKYGQFGSAPYLAMDYVEGGITLSQLLAERESQGGWLTRDEFAAIVGQLLDALEAAHARDIVHRDIKPDNIMLQRLGGAGWLLRLLDFGIAKDIGAGGTTVHTMGTPAYMAPEQLKNRGIGPWTDLYAVGVLVFELLTGREPFPSASIQELLQKKVDPSYDPAAALADLAIGPALLGFLRRALAREPDARFRSAAALRAALPEALADVPTLPLPHAAGLSPAEAVRYRADSDESFQQWLATERARLDLEHRRLTTTRHISARDVDGPAPD